MREDTRTRKDQAGQARWRVGCEREAVHAAHNWAVACGVKGQGESSISSSGIVAQKAGALAYTDAV